MAQLPWSVVESLPVTFHKARLSAKRCAQELSQVLENSAVKTRVVSLLEAFVDALEECEANEFIKQNVKHVPCLSVVKAKGVVQIHPSYMGDALKGVYYYLSHLLMQYNEDVNGIWLSFGKIKQVDKVGYLTDGDTYGIISLRISLRILLFTPQSGGNMFGKITKADPTRASLLVYGVFGVTVRRSETADGETPPIADGDLVDVKVTDVKVLQKNKWVILSTTMDNLKVIS